MATPTLFWLLLAWNVIFHPHLESMSIVRAEMGLLWAAQSWVLYFYLCLLIGAFNMFTFRVIIDMQALDTAILSFDFGYFVSPLFLFPSASLYVCILVVFSDQFFSLPFFYILCLYSTFLLCGYPEAYIKYLIDKTVLLLLIATYLFSAINVLPFYSSPFYIFDVTNYLFVL